METGFHGIPVFTRALFLEKQVLFLRIQKNGEVGVFVQTLLSHRQK